MPTNRKVVMLRRARGRRNWERKRDALLGGTYDCPECPIDSTLNCTTRGKPGAYTFIFSCACGFTHVDTGKSRESVIDIYNRLRDLHRRDDELVPSGARDFRVLKLLETDVRMR